jgi:hypothetical protein
VCAHAAAYAQKRLATVGTYAPALLLPFKKNPASCVSKRACLYQ